LIVLEERDDGSQRELRRLGRGVTFGELALLEGTPRTATVRAVATCELFAFSRGAFDRTLAASLRREEVTRTFHQLAEVAALPSFRNLPLHEVEAVANSGSWVRAPAGEAVVVEGEPADAFYAIAAGRFEVTKGGAKLREIGPGDHFGEVALLSGVARTATVRAVTPGTLFRLGAEGFDRLVAALFREGAVRVPYEIAEPRD